MPFYRVKARWSSKGMLENAGLGLGGEVTMSTPRPVSVSSSAQKWRMGLHPSWQLFITTYWVWPMNLEEKGHALMLAGLLDTSLVPLHNPFNFPKLYQKQKDSKNIKEKEPQDEIP